MQNSRNSMHVCSLTHTWLTYRHTFENNCQFFFTHTRLPHEMHKVAVLDKIFLLKSLCLCSKICLFRHDICFPELRNLPTYSAITDMLLSGGANGYHWRKIKHIFTESDCCTVRCDAIACVGSFHLLKQWRQQVLQKRWHKYNILITVTPRKLVIHVFPFP